MNQLRLEVRNYAVEREVPCVLCGRFFGQQVAVVLFDGPRQRGDVCPDCLAGGPVEAAESARERAARLRSRSEQLRQEAARAVAWAARAREQAARVLAQTEELLALADRLRQERHWPVCPADARAAEREGPPREVPQAREEPHRPVRKFLSPTG